MHILIVDDLDESRLLLRGILEFDGHEVVEAIDGREALAHLRLESPDLVISDILMPNLDGFGLRRAMYRDECLRRIPLIFYTATFVDQVDERLAHDLGARFVVKPQTSEVLLGLISEIGEHRRTIDTTELDSTAISGRIEERLTTKLAEKAAELDDCRERIAAFYRHLPSMVYREDEVRLRLFNAVFENTLEGIMITDDDATILAVNPAFTAITGYSEAEAIGNKLSMLQSDRQPPEFYETMWNTLSTEGVWRGELWSRRKSGEFYPHWLVINAVTDNEGGVIHYVGVFSDISRIERSQQELEHLAHYDPLTGLPNRTLFTARLEHALTRAKRDGRVVALLFLDLDRFNQINDRLGHRIGDELLRAIAEQLLSSVRTGDTVARLGGDEFVIVLEGLEHAEQAGLVVRKVIAALDAPFSIDDHELYVSASVGISTYPNDGDTVGQLQSRADTAMSRAKSQGRDTYCYYTEEMTRHAFKVVVFESEFKHAIENNELELFYQPQIDLRTSSLFGVEALVYWDHPQRGLLESLQFMPSAEEGGLVRMLGEWILTRACRQGKQWLDDGVGFGRIAVSLGAAQIMQGGPVDLVDRALDASGLPPSMLELEIAAEMLVSEHGIVDLLGKLASMRIRLSVDDFGTGYISLAHLRRLPLAALKIDHRITRGVPDDADCAAITKAVIAMAHNLRLEAVAAAVETGEQLGFLHAAGCDHAQGKLFAVPMTGEAFGEWSRRGRFNNGLSEE